MARPKGVAELPRKMQGGVLRWLKMSAKKGRPVSAMMEECYQHDKLGTLKFIGSLMPKELLMEVNHDHQHAIDMSGVDLNDIISLARARREVRSLDGVPGQDALDSPGGTAGSGLLIEG